MWLLGQLLLAKAVEHIELLAEGVILLVPAGGQLDLRRVSRGQWRDTRAGVNLWVVRAKKSEMAMTVISLSNGLDILPPP